MGISPAAIAAMAAAAAGTGSAYAANKSQNAKIEAQAQAERGERFRQAELQRQADAKVQQGIAEFTPEKQAAQVQDATQERTAALQQATAPVDQYQAATAAAPVEVGNDLSRRLEGAQAGVNDAAARRAKLAAYGDASMREGFDIQRIREALNRKRLESQASSRILPYELRETENKGKNWKNASAISGILGKAAGAYAMGAGGSGSGIGYGTADPTQAGIGMTGGANFPY